ncbi:MAG: cyclic nucleotide-binding domain-containing protein, partial [Ghiorsea sp.]|nr:cyclic nucleotide-binding domain-containing protein [Ghiorsea sp.]
FLSLFAKELLYTGHEVRATFEARKAYQLLSQENPPDAEALVEEYGLEVRSTPTQPFIGEDYTQLSKIFGRIKLKMRSMQLRPDSILFRKGDIADNIYLILDGELAVSHDNHGSLSLLNHLHAGSLLGEGALHEGAVRKATVAATKSTTLLRISPKELIEAFLKYPDLHIQFAKESLLRRRVTDLTMSPVFSCLPTDLRFMLAKRVWNTSHPAGSTIKPANEYMSNVELILQGEVHLYEDDSYCGRIQKGGILGLHKIMDGKASQLRFIAKSECAVICMDFMIIEDLMGISNRFQERIRDAAAGFSAQVSHTMSLQEE